MEIHATKNPSGITVSLSTDGSSVCKEFTFRRKGRMIARLTVYISGSVFVDSANTVHVNERRIDDVKRHCENYCDISFKSDSGQEN